tara:strand:- start:938 stop:1282 length:345 start_codon:yes stop_codon:yes gene_type:complete
MSVYVRNLTISSHSNFSEDLELVQTGGQATDLTGFTVNSHMRKHPDSSNYHEFTVGITSAKEGKMTLSMGSTITSSIKPGRYLYDVAAIRENGATSIILEGTVNVRAGFSTNCP